MKILENLPKEFAELENPVKKLYYKGDLSLFDKPKVAIIGSRKMSVYTKNCVLELASLLKQAGVCVVSGGALGVDITAHQGAYPSTIGIFANGLNEIYPKNNEKIIKQIYENALALSENEPNYLPHGYDFLLRNRLIIALSEFIIIAQADFKSGSFQSANLAVRLGKKVFVLPQRKNESEGTNSLLEQGKVRLLNNFKAFALQFGALKQEQNDEILDFCKNGVSKDEAIKRYGEKIYEYELEGKIEICGVMVRTKL